MGPYGRGEDNSAPKNPPHSEPLAGARGLRGFRTLVAKPPLREFGHSIGNMRLGKVSCRRTMTRGRLLAYTKSPTRRGPYGSRHSPSHGIEAAGVLPIRVGRKMLFP